MNKQNNYLALKAYLDNKNLRLENFEFNAILKSINLKSEGWSSREANSFAFTTYCIEQCQQDLKVAAFYKKMIATHSVDVVKLLTSNS